MKLARAALAACVITCCPSLLQAQEATVHIGTVRSLGSLATMIAVEKGYFKEAGVKVEVENLDTSGDAMALIAQGRLQVMEGGLSATYFNALQKDLPVTVAADRVSTPVHHELVVRSDLKDQVKTIADLKGRTISANSRGAVNNYEIAKVLESTGLTLKDVEVKFMPFTQVPIAFANKALDAGMLVPPFGAQIAEKGLGFVLADSDDYVKPSPMIIAVAFINSDWAKQNDDLVRRYFVAYMRGVRDYCQAYHGGSNRAEAIDIAVRTGTERNPDMLNKYPWPARSPLGQVPVDSVLDLQNFFVKEGLAQKAFPAERLYTSRYVDYANEKLGPFVLENKDSKLAGCR